MALAPLDHAVRRLAASQYGLFTVAQVLALGGTRDTVRQRRRRGVWNPVADGVYELPGAPHTWRYRLKLALLVAGPGAVVSHAAAAALWRLPGFPEGPIEILAPHGCKNHRVAGV